MCCCELNRLCLLNLAPRLFIALFVYSVLMYSFTLLPRFGTSLLTPSTFNAVMSFQLSTSVLLSSTVYLNKRIYIPITPQIRLCLMRITNISSVPASRYQRPRVAFYLGMALLTTQVCPWSGSGVADAPT